MNCLNKFISREKDVYMDNEPEEDVQPKDEEDLTLIDPEMFWDLLMEQQEQM